MPTPPVAEDAAPPVVEDAVQRRFAEWGREHGHAIRGYVLALVRGFAGCGGRSADLADDITQEVFFRAWQARRRYREQGTARAYLLRIADRLVCDRGRRARPSGKGREITLDEELWRQVEPISPGSEPADKLVRAEAAEQLTEALDNLSPQQRRVLLLRYYGQLTFAEIAETMDCPLNTTLSHCRRGLMVLRKLMVEDTR